MRKTLALMFFLLLVLAACGGDSADEPADAGAAQTTAATEESMADEEMADEEMADEEMADEEMADEEMADEEMADEEMADEEMADEMGDVLDVAAGESDLGTFLSGLDAAGIMEDLHGEGPFTLFVPTDEAFEAYLADAGMTADEAFANQEMLGTVLENHIVLAHDDAEMVMGMDGQSFTATSGLDLAVAVDGDTVTVNEATILRYDIHASNGIIHVIDSVLAGA